MFWEVTEEVMTDEVFWGRDNYIDICWDLYQSIWKKKKMAKVNNLKTPGQRYAPCVNIEATRDQVERSVQLMVAMHHAFQQLNYFQLKDPYFNGRAWGIFAIRKMEYIMKMISLRNIFWE